MPLPLLATSVLAVLLVGYVAYGRMVARRYGLDPAAVTPAVSKADGADHVPTAPFYLLGQHFSAIAAAGPIVGPIAACLLFGWVPCVLWIALGAVLIGAVHDLTALVASVRHGARSVAEVARRHLGTRAWLTLVGFVWIALVYVIVAFTDVTVETFLGATEELSAAGGSFNKGGAVALSASVYLLLAMAMGIVQRALRPPLWVTTLVFVPAALGAIWVGTDASTVLLADRTTWRVAILAYCFVASLLPFWLLLQPRGYLGGFVLYLALAAGVLGMFFGGYDVEQPAFRGFVDETSGLTLFPFLFVTIACGACSGFHGLVCGGTTSKQIARETHCRPVGYGAMLLEAFVALVALATVLVLPSSGGRSPGVLYGEGIAGFLTDVLGLSPQAALYATTFGLMAFSTFVFDTLDVATRLGRYLLQELTGRRGTTAALVATAATVGVPLAVVLGGRPGGWRDFWLLFGSSNQLLAALTLVAATVWLRRSGKRAWFTLWPAVFVMAMTVWALGVHVADGWSSIRRGAFDTPALNGVVAAALLLLAATFVADAVRAARRGAREAVVA
jgi:carbon starvation protein